MSGYSWLGAVIAVCSETTEGMGVTTGATGPANEAATMAPETGAMPGSVIRPA